MLRIALAVFPLLAFLQIVSANSCRAQRTDAVYGDEFFSASDTTGDPVELSVGLRIAVSENPRYLSSLDNRASHTRAGLLGAQLTITHEKHFRLGFGLERLATDYTHLRSDTTFGVISDNQFTGWFFYLSPGVHARLGEDQPLGLGVHVDAGFLWARENYFEQGYSGSWGNRMAAIRPKAIATYDLLPGMHIQFEAGWLWAANGGYAHFGDYLDGPMSTSTWQLDYTGPFFGSMLTYVFPGSTGKKKPHPFGPLIQESVPTLNWGLRIGFLPASANSGPARWEFDGSYGSSIARGLQVSISTSQRIEIGTGVELISTPPTTSRDSILGGALHASATFLYATVGYEGLPTPSKSVPLGVWLDVGHMWSHETIEYVGTGWAYSERGSIQGHAARLKLTASPEISHVIGLRFELGWLFAALGHEEPPGTYPDSRHRWFRTDPSAIDFSGPSLMAMIRLRSVGSAAP